MRLNVIDFPDGGWLRELYKDGFQISVRVIPPHEESGGSRHRKTDEKWWVAAGKAAIAFEYQDIGYVKRVVEGPMDEIVDIPAGTGHQIVNIGDVPVVLIWHSGREYGPDKPDKEPWEDPFPGGVE